MDVDSNLKMGCEHSNPQRLLYIDKSKRSPFMVLPRINSELRPQVTKEQKKLIQVTWEVIKADIARVGVITFLRYRYIHNICLFVYRLYFTCYDIILYAVSSKWITENLIFINNAS